MAEVKEMARPKTNGPQARAPEKTKPGLTPRDERRADRLAHRASLLALRAGSPFSFIRRFAEEMDRLIDDFGFEPGRHLSHLFGRAGEPGAAEGEWMPRVDIREHDGMLVVRADLPGMAREDIQVEMTEDQLTIAGERKRETREERAGYAYSECSYGRFSRSIPLPEGVDPAKATAEFHNGILEVVMPAPQPARPRARRLEVQEKKR